MTELTIIGRVTGWLRSVAPDRAAVKTDLVAGLPGAIGSVPDGMAASVLAGVNPIHGLYASFAGPVAGGLSASTKLMVITTTSAAALAAGSALESLSAEDRPEALFLLTVIAGVAMTAAGFLRLGRFTRFVSQSVMIGFLSGVAVNIIAGQIPDLTGAEGEGSVAVQKAWSVVTNPSGIDLASVLTGVAAFAIIVLLGRTRIASFSAVVALAVPTMVVVLSGADVAQVMDQGDIPLGIPLPALPPLSVFSWSLLAGALAVAAIVLVQGVGVAESAPNEDGTRSNTNADFIAQGMGNLGSGLFQGQPVGGSVGQTAMNQAAGARTRWASIFSGLWMLLILALFSGIVGVVAMPTLAALLIYAGAGSLRLGEIGTIWRTGVTSQIAIASTFIATLLLPVATAVGLGVVLSLLLQLNQAALDLKVVELVPGAGGGLEESPTLPRPGQLQRHLDRYLRQPSLRRGPHPRASPPRPDRHHLSSGRDADARPNHAGCNVLHGPVQLRRSDRRRGWTHLRFRTRPSTHFTSSQDRCDRRRRTGAPLRSEPGDR